MKILFATDTYPPHVNGASLATYRTVQELKKRGYDIYVIAPSTSLRNYTKVEDGVTVFRLSSVLVQKSQEFRMSPQLFHRSEIKKIISEVNPDIIHVNNPGFIAQSAIKEGLERGIPLVGHHHFMPDNLVHYFHLPDKVERAIEELTWKFFARIYNQLDVIITPTPLAANVLFKKKIIPPVYPISNGIDLSKFRVNNNGDYLKDRYKLPQKVTILFIGRLDKEKNLSDLLNALAILKQKADFHMVIVGKGKELAGLKRQAKLLGIETSVTFTGFLPDKDLPNIYKVADVFVMPGTAELQSLVTMEAMASGLPVVGADAVALPNLIKDGLNGYLFEPHNVSDLASKLYEIVSNNKLRRDMANNSAEMIKEHDINKTTQEIEDVYKMAIERAKKRKAEISSAAKLKHYTKALTKKVTYAVKNI